MNCKLVAARASRVPPYLQRNVGDTDCHRARPLRVTIKRMKTAAIGDGPVDAVYKAISTVMRSSARLVRYDVRAVTSGTGAVGEAIVHLERDGLRAVGRGVSTDVIEASAKAYLDALNRLTALPKPSGLAPESESRRSVVAEFRA